MGRAKQEWMEAQERGWNAPDKYVCKACVEDFYLKHLIDSNIGVNSCDYCGETVPAAPVECLMKSISHGLHNEFNDFESAGCPYDSEMPEIATYSTEDALVSIPLECHETLLEDIEGSFHNEQWVKAPGGWWAGSHTHDDLRWSWEGFAHTVKYQTRFHFGNLHGTRNNDPGEVPVADFLPMIGRLVERHKLLQVLPAKTKVYRVRLRESGAPWVLNAEQLGTPQPAKTQAGRMNPAGIPYLYTAFNPGTAVAETVSRPPQSVALASFVSMEDITILDLTKLPTVPSPFDLEKRYQRDELIFLENFVWDIKQPVQRDGSEHIEYVPTQVICEYFAQAFVPSNGGEAKIAGIKYPSAVNPGHSNLVLFPRKDEYRNPFAYVSFEGAEEVEFGTWEAFTSYLLHY
jgi:RES domain-containing protein